MKRRLLARLLAAIITTGISNAVTDTARDAVAGIEGGAHPTRNAGMFVVSDRPSWVLAGGSVEAIVRWHDTLYLGGDFDQLGPFTGSAAVISRRDGAVSAHLPAVVDGEVRAVVDDGSGGWFLGGRFLRVGGVPCPGLAHIRADGSHDSNWCPNPGVGYRDGEDRVLALARSDSTLFVGGEFKTIAGEQRLRLAAFDTRTGELLPWNPSVRGKPVFDRRTRIPRGVHALETVGSILYVGGFFEQVGGQPRTSIAAVDAVTGRTTSWVPTVRPSWASVDALSVADGLVYVGGSFTSLGGRPQNGLGAIDTTGRSTSWKPALTELSDVYALAVAGEQVFVGGHDLTRPGSSLVAFNRSSAAPSWQAVTEEWINAVEASEGVVYFGGLFDEVNGVTRHRLAAVDAVTGKLTSWDPRANYDVLALQAEGDELVAGGRFTGVGGELRSNLAAVSAITGEIQPFNPDLGFEVEALAVIGDTLYVGGDKLASISLPEGTPTGPSRNTNGYIHTIATDHEAVYVGGAFSKINGKARRNLAAFSATGQLLPWKPRLDGSATWVNAVVVRAGSIFAAVTANADGDPVLYELRTSDGSTMRTWAGKLSTAPTVWSLSLNGNRLYLAGDFSSLDGQTRQNFAAILTDTGEVTPWVAPSTTRDGEGWNIAATEQTVYMSGRFNRATGRSQSVIAADATTGAVLPWQPEPLSRYQPDVFLVGDTLYLNWAPLAAYDPNS